MKIENKNSFKVRQGSVSHRTHNREECPPDMALAGQLYRALHAYGPTDDPDDLTVCLVFWFEPRFFHVGTFVCGDECTELANESDRDGYL